MGEVLVIAPTQKGAEAFAKAEPLSLEFNKDAATLYANWQAYIEDQRLPEVERSVSRPKRDPYRLVFRLKSASDLHRPLRVGEIRYAIWIDRWVPTIVKNDSEEFSGDAWVTLIHWTGSSGYPLGEGTIYAWDGQASPLKIQIAATDPCDLGVSLEVIEP